MEKDDKIKDQQLKTKKYGLIVLVGLVGLLGIYSLKGREGFQPRTNIDSNSNNNAVRRDTVNAVAQQQHNNDDSTANDAADMAARLEQFELLEEAQKKLDEEVRAIKKTGVIMETDPTSLKKTAELKEVTRNLLKAKYGDHEAYRVKVDLEFQPSIPDYEEKGPAGSITIEMAPIEYQPVSVYTFLEVARTWVRGAFHRNAGHVLQVQVVSDAVHKHLPFQEYSKEFPHKKGTTGYCGRPSGPCWYVSIQDNTFNHGPGSQQKANPYEADANFGTVVEGFDDVVPRIHSVKQQGWLSPENQIKIIHKTVLVPDGQGEFKEWVDWTKAAKATS